MSKEIQVGLSVTVQYIDPTTGIRQVNYQRAETYTIDLATKAGPFIGTVLATVGGTFVPLTAVTAQGPLGLCLFTNQDVTNKAYVGFYDNNTGRFSPFARLLPGITVPVYLPEKLEEWAVGAGTASAMSEQLMVKSVGGSVNVRIDAFPE